MSKRKNYQKMRGDNHIINMDFASLYPTTMKSFDEDWLEEYKRKQIREARERKLRRILNEDNEG